MTNTEKKEKLIEYSDRHQFWRDKVFNQMAYSINLFLTIGFGLMGLLISQKEEYSNWAINTTLDFNWNVVHYFLTMLTIFISIIIGTISVTSRLFDLRFTSNTLKTRKRVLKKFGETLTEDYPEKHMGKQLTVYFCAFFWSKNYRISGKDYPDLNLIKKKFLILRGLTSQLGRLTWTTHKIQIITTLIAVLMYGLLILF
jgi:hypothetical protein